MEKVALYDFYELKCAAAGKSCLLRDICTVQPPEETPASGADGSAYKLSAFRQADGVFAVRILADRPGLYRFRIGGFEGSFLCDPTLPHGHGRVRTKGDAFVYEDGSKYLPFGTTSYGWIHQPARRQNQTVKTLTNACFNKIRMLIFPKFMPYNETDPFAFPFGRQEGKDGWDVDAIVPAFWDNLDRRMKQLRDLGVEADLILWHPYDKWGFASMPYEQNLKYLEYMIARYAAYCNVWWSLANEYEMALHISLSDWNDFGTYLAEKDPYQHLRSIHQIISIYPQREWMTHLSVQSGNINFVPIWKRKYGGIPVIIDECGYEGDIEYDWGNLSAQEMVHSFWWTVCRGGYCTHGETFHREDGVLWWGKGGRLYGKSEPRIKYLKDLLETLPGVGRALEGDPTDPNAAHEGSHSESESRFLRLVAVADEEMLTGVHDMTPKQLDGDGWFLRYYGMRRPCMSTMDLDDASKWDIQVIDTWNMTKTIVLEGVSGQIKVPLGAIQGAAVLGIRCQEQAYADV